MGPRSGRGWRNAPCRQDTSQGWCSGPGWPDGTRLLGPLRSGAVLSEALRGTGGRLACWWRGVDGQSVETSCSSAGCRVRAETGAAEDDPSGWRRGGRGSSPGLWVQVWMMGNHTDPSFKTHMMGARKC